MENTKDFPLEELIDISNRLADIYNRNLGFIAVDVIGNVSVLLRLDRFKLLFVRYDIKIDSEGDYRYSKLFDNVEFIAYEYRSDKGEDE